MKEVIREGVFETNSSSMHSLVINSGNLTDTLELNEDGNIEYIEYQYDVEFGWGYAIYSDAYAKSLYCLVDNQYDDERLELVKDVIKTKTCANDIIINYDDWYIDHQSCGTTKEELYTYADFENFIFNSNCKLIIDNDNH